jgi:hypothetical protein
MNKNSCHWYSKNSFSNNDDDDDNNDNNKDKWVCQLFPTCRSEQNFEAVQDERTDGPLTLTANTHKNKHNILWKNAFTLLALFISSLYEFCVTACDFWPYVGLKIYLYCRLFVQIRWINNTSNIWSSFLFSVRSCDFKFTGHNVEWSDSVVPQYLNRMAAWNFKIRKQNRVHFIMVFKEPTTGSDPEPDDSSPPRRSISNIQFVLI